MIKPLTENECQALNTLLEYSWKDEYEDYFDPDHSGEHGKGCHIFESMVTLDNYLRCRKGLKPLTAQQHFEA